MGDNSRLGYGRDCNATISAEKMARADILRSLAMEVDKIMDQITARQMMLMYYADNFQLLFYRTAAEGKPICLKYANLFRKCIDALEKLGVYQYGGANPHSTT